jgi:hypothetical protein
MSKGHGIVEREVLRVLASPEWKASLEAEGKAGPFSGLPHTSLAKFLPQFSRQSISRAVRKLAIEKRVCLLHAPRDRKSWGNINPGGSYWGVLLAEDVPEDWREGWGGPYWYHPAKR